MAIPYATLYSELEELVAATWTDLVSGGSHYIREADHIASIPFDTLVEQRLPYGVIVFPAPEPTEMGIANRCFLLRCEFWYVAETAIGSANLWTPAEALASALWQEGRTPSVITAGQVWSDSQPRAMWGWELPINRLLQAKKLPILAAGATATILVGEQA